LAALVVLSVLMRAEYLPDAVPLTPLVVTAGRQSLAPEEVPVGLTVLDAGDARNSAALTADDFLRQVPGFSLFHGYRL